MPSKYAYVDGTAVHYLHTGPTTLPDVVPALDRGRLFLFLHAAGSTAGLWRRQLDGVGVRHSAVAPDLPAHGRSAGLEALASVEAYADFVAAFVRVLGLRPCIVVGRSMGGAVALTLAARAPEVVAGLVVVCSAARFAFPPERLATHRDVARGRLPQQFTTETFSPGTGMDVMREAWTEQVKTDPRVRYADMLACAAFDGRPLVARVRARTLVVAGADDGVTPRGCSEELSSGIADAHLAVLDGAGHQAPLEQADAFNGLLADFADSMP